MPLFPAAWNFMKVEERQEWWSEARREKGFPPIGTIMLNAAKLPGEDVLVVHGVSVGWTVVHVPGEFKYRWKQLCQGLDADPAAYILAWSKELWDVESSWLLPEPPRQSEVILPRRASVKVLEEAADIITGDRLREYGPPEENFARIATYWNQYLADNPPPLKPSDVAMLMVFVKIAREAQAHKTDSSVDGAAYIAIYEELKSREEEQK